MARWSATPYYNKATQRGLIAHYTAIADATDLPIIVYNVPSRTGLNMLPETFARLAEHENICAMKEASGNIEQVTELARLCVDDIALYSGNDDQVLPLLALGGQGVISVSANIVPEKVAQMVAMYMAGDVKGCRNTAVLPEPAQQGAVLRGQPDTGQDRDEADGHGRGSAQAAAYRDGGRES